MTPDKDRIDHTMLCLLKEVSPALMHSDSVDRSTSAKNVTSDRRPTACDMQHVVISCNTLLGDWRGAVVMTAQVSSL